MAEAADGDVVIVGFGLEAPGGINDATGFWSALAAGRELIGPFPQDRGWDLAQFGAQWPGVDIPDAGGFLADALHFDPEFFGIGASEARVAMDAQQAVALRVAWRALENAGINPGNLRGRSFGCFIGAGPARSTGLLGNAAAGVSGRIAHTLGTTGPTLTVDTAGASGLTALHLAVSAVRSGGCDLALVGGVSIMDQPAIFGEAAELGILSSDGHNRSFADDATGLVWGEGAGVLVVERESRAVREGHRIHGRILSCLVNHNGGHQRIFGADGDAQVRLMRASLTTAEIAPERIGLIEGHGLAVRSSDIIEMRAIREVYSGDGRSDTEAVIGSVKSNVGHTRAAGGILGLIKVLLCGRHGKTVPGLCVSGSALKGHLSRSGLRFATESAEWPAVGGSRFASVSALGFSGSNAHAIVEIPDDAGTE